MPQPKGSALRVCALPGPPRGPSQPAPLPLGGLRSPGPPLTSLAWPQLLCPEQTHWAESAAPGTAGSTLPDTALGSTGCRSQRVPGLQNPKAVNERARRRQSWRWGGENSAQTQPGTPLLSPQLSWQMQEVQQEPGAWDWLSCQRGLGSHPKNSSGGRCES